VAVQRILENPTLREVSVPHPDTGDIEQGGQSFEVFGGLVVAAAEARHGATGGSAAGEPLH
jgi:hypothetical protein